MIRSALVAGVASLALVLLIPSPDRGPSRVTIRADAVPLARHDPALARVGPLTFLGGWSLNSTDRRFGGLSSMVVLADRVLAISDAGSSLSFRLRPGGRVDDGWITPLPSAAPRSEPKKHRDSEALTIDPAIGETWVAFENVNEIRRYDASRLRVIAHARPSGMADWPVNSGAETLLRLPDGRFIALSEDAPQPGGANAAVLFLGDPTARGTRQVRFGYRPPAGYQPTDAALLPGGRVLVLHRRFSILDGFSAVLSVLDPARIVPGKTIAAREIARLAPPLTVDNMEAIAVTRERGRTIVWIASDDNFNAIQRTLLMRFALDPIT